MSITVYFDVCCLNRPFDDQAQDRIRLESEAVLLVLGHIETGEWDWISSEVVDYEIGRNPSVERRQRLLSITAHAGDIVLVSDAVSLRAAQLEVLGFHAVDALHVASAEAGQADVLLTVDDGLLRLAGRNITALKVPVWNPVSWMEGRFKP